MTNLPTIKIGDKVNFLFNEKFETGTVLWAYKNGTYAISRTATKTVVHVERALMFH